MARRRQLDKLKVGEYQATCFWMEGSGIEHRERYAEFAGVKVEEKWVYIYLNDGEEVVRLSRTRNSSAQIYIDMSVRDVMRERVGNRVSNSTSCCYARFGSNPGMEYDSDHLKRECTIHTPEWMDKEIDMAVGLLIPDDIWPSILAELKIDALKAEIQLAREAVERATAKVAGFGEWKKHNREWLVSIEDHRTGDIVSIRRRDGTVSRHELTEQISSGLYRAGKEIPEAKEKEMVAWTPLLSS
jgi:hypothetical protein